MKNLVNKLRDLHACDEAIEWVNQNSDKDVAHLWATCERGDWLLWLVGTLNIDHKRSVLAACQCARLSLHLVPENELRPKIAIETAEAWVRGEASVHAVRDAAADAAAYAAAYAAHVVVAAAAAYDAAYAAAHAAAARNNLLNTCADIVRQHFNCAEVIAKL